MASVQYGTVIKPLRVLLHAGPMSGWSDGDLIERFLETDTDAAELAFAAIVDRHGPMVRRVCRQMLGDFHDSVKPFMMALKEADKNRMLIKYGELGFVDAQIACEPRFTNQLGVVDLVYKIAENTPPSRLPRNPVLNESSPRAK